MSKTSEFWKNEAKRHKTLWTEEGANMMPTFFAIREGKILGIAISQDSDKKTSLRSAVAFRRTLDCDRLVWVVDAFSQMRQLTDEEAADPEKTLQEISETENRRSLSELAQDEESRELHGINECLLIGECDTSGNISIQVVPYVLDKETRTITWLDDKEFTPDEDGKIQGEGPFPNVIREIMTSPNDDVARISHFLADLMGVPVKDQRRKTDLGSLQWLAALGFNVIVNPELKNEEASRNGD